MATTSSIRTVATRALVLAAVLAAVMARAAAAQRAPTIRASASVVGSVQAYALRADTTGAAPDQRVQRLRIEGVGSLDVDCGPGGVIRFAPREVDRPARVIQVTIDYIGN